MSYRSNKEKNAHSVKIHELPIDILYCIIPYLDVPSFIALTSTCHALNQRPLTHHSWYWSHATRTTFRVPVQPIVANHGTRWRHLYKLLLTQSRVYTWGHDDTGYLGHGPSNLSATILGGLDNTTDRTTTIRRSVNVSWPQEMQCARTIGVVADMQCGGWSTNLLSSRGSIWTVGVVSGLARGAERWRGMRGLRTTRARAAAGQRVHGEPVALRYPPGFVHPDERYEASTAVKQFSAGRSHVLALSDSGRIWTWHNADCRGLSVRFLNVEMREGAREGEVGHVRKVVAGWNRSSALVNGAGIVVWEPISSDEEEGEEEESEMDTILVLETATVPLTAQQDAQVGKVQNYICLEDYILFNTGLGKVFASKITWSEHEQSVSEPRQLLLPASPSSSLSDRDTTDDSPVSDVQGSFRSFGIFTSAGAVLTGTQDMLDNFFNTPPQTHAQPLPLNRIPALQNTSVTSLAFGDYHFHALHATGHITSYGTEPQGCGAFGLGGHRDPTGRLRGIRYGPSPRDDATLVAHAYSTGRRVWFEHEKQAWLTFLARGGGDPVEGRERMQMCAEDASLQGEVSEWVEREGRAWSERFLSAAQLASGKDDEEEGLGPYFVLAVTAAGWHSGAVVLVDEEVANEQRERCLIPAAATVSAAIDDTGGCGGRKYKWEDTSSSTRDVFPRLRLADGTEMPGTVAFSTWRGGDMPVSRG